MGLSSSQARLLNLTSRIHQIEYKAAKLEAAKLQMANKSTQVYNDYLNALEAVKIQKKIITNDGSTTFIDSTYNNLIGNKLYDNKVYMLNSLETGELYVPAKYKSAYDCSNKTVTGFLTTLNDLTTDTNSYTPITSADELLALSGKSGTYRLDCDLVLTDWEGISNFSGIFDGNGHTITIKGSSGLFNTISNTQISNLNVSADIDSTEYIGGIVNYGTNIGINNCNVTGNLTSTERIVGGLIGVIKEGLTISNSSTTTDICSNFRSAHDGDSNYPQDYYGRCGGFIGYTNKDSVVVINDCASVGGTVKYSYWQVGGLIGQSNGTVEINRCYVDNDVTVNHNGYGNTYARNYNSGGNTYFVPRSGATLVGLCNKGTVTVNDSNIYGSVSTGGNTDLYGMTGDSKRADNYIINNSYSSMGDNSYSNGPINFSSEPSMSDYPEISSEGYDAAINIFRYIELSGGAIAVPDEYLNSSTWLTNIINNGFGILSVADMDDDSVFYFTSVATDTNLQEIPDETLLKKAEAKYEADMKQIDMKDRKYDTDLAALENERNAIKQEIESLKTVARDNVERTFKLFS